MCWRVFKWQDLAINKPGVIKKCRLWTHCLHSLQGQSVYIKFWFGFRLTFRVYLVWTGTKGHYAGSQLLHECLTSFTHFQNQCFMMLGENNLFDEDLFRNNLSIRHYSPGMKTLWLLAKFRLFPTIFCPLQFLKNPWKMGVGYQHC